MNEQISFDPDSLKSFLFVVYDVGVGYRAPILAYSDFAIAYNHFLEMLSKYPGDVSSLKLVCVGEFSPLSDHPISVYDQFFEVNSDHASSAVSFDSFIYKLVDKFFTSNPDSVHKLSFKNPNDPSDVLSDSLRSRFGGVDNASE